MAWDLRTEIGQMLEILEKICSVVAKPEISLG